MIVDPAPRTDAEAALFKFKIHGFDACTFAQLRARCAGVTLVTHSIQPAFSRPDQ